MSLNTTPATFVASNVLTAAQLNLQVRDAVTGIQAAWSAYTPTVGGGLTLGNGTVTGTSNRMGKTIDFTVVFTFGSTSSITSAPTFTLPVTALTFNWATADCCLLDTSAGQPPFPFVAIATSTTVVTARPWPAAAGAAFGGVNATTPITWATGDILSIAGRYQAA